MFRRPPSLVQSALSGVQPLRFGALAYDCYLVDSASSHMLVSKIKPCMSKYKQLYRDDDDDIGLTPFVASQGAFWRAPPRVYSVGALPRGPGLEYNIHVVGKGKPPGASRPLFGQRQQGPGSVRVAPLYTKWTE